MAWVWWVAWVLGGIVLVLGAAVAVAVLVVVVAMKRKHARGDMTGRGRRR